MGKKKILGIIRDSQTLCSTC